jgi:hypothetical protein
MISSCSAPTGSKPVDILENAYNDSRGVTAEFILNVFRHINRRLKSNFDLSKMRYDSRFNAEWRRIEMYAVARRRSGQSFFPPPIAAFVGRNKKRFSSRSAANSTPNDCKNNYASSTSSPSPISPTTHEWFSVLLFKKA